MFEFMLCYLMNKVHSSHIKELFHEKLVFGKLFNFQIICAPSSIENYFLQISHMKFVTCILISTMDMFVKLHSTVSKIQYM